MNYQLEDEFPTTASGKTSSPSGRGGPVVLASASIGLFVVLALALGLGLGLGLRHHNSTSTLASASSASSLDYNLPLGNESWRQSPSEYVLNMKGWDYSASPTTRSYNFTVSEIDAFPDGVLRKVLVVNGKYPGPMIRCNRGDRLLINVTNEMSNSTTIHWHGLYQNGTNWMDGTAGITQCPIPTGRSFLYNFTVENQYGTFWWHSHKDTQRMDGLFGPLIIHAPEEVEYQKRYGYTSDQIIILQDYYHDLSSALLPTYLAPENENAEPVPDNGLIQGTNYFNCSSYGPNSGYTCYDNSTRALLSVQQNTKTRFRLINMGGFATFEYAIDNHTVTIIEGDSTMVEPLPRKSLKIAPAQRYSFIVEANQPVTNYWMRAEMETNCFATTNDVLNSTAYAILAYDNSTVIPGSGSVSQSFVYDPLCEDLDSSLRLPSVGQEAPAAEEFFVIQFGFQSRDYAIDLAYINGTTWKESEVPTLNRILPHLRASNSTYNRTGPAPSYGLTNQFILDIPENRVVDILLQNFDDGSHPFHLHGYDFWVMASSNSQYFDYSRYHTLNQTNPMRRDTVMVDAYGWTLIRIQADNPGLWALHCHIAWHVAAGLLMQLQTRDDLMKDWTLPDDVLDLCNA